MIEQFKSYFVKLERLSSAELDRSAEKLVVAENGNIAKLIAHIAEMSARKVALELGYKNLFDYCIRRLNLSEGAVPARIHVANVSRRFPQLLVALAENRISLTVASLLAAHVSENNVDKLPWCTTRDLGPQLSFTHGFEVPHEHFQTHSAEVCEEGLSREELA